MVFIETRMFSRLLPACLSDGSYLLLQEYLMQKPDAGRLIRGSGGLRKVRWAGTTRSGNKGKSGGLRIIYYWKKSDDEIWFLTLYAKSDRASISTDELKQISRILEIENDG
jgi:mRNA-degrading endonuclease RelE of RelBE toxin-antitoxin system